MRPTIKKRLLLNFRFGHVFNLRTGRIRLIQSNLDVEAMRELTILRHSLSSHRNGGNRGDLKGLVEDLD